MPLFPRRVRLHGAGILFGRILVRNNGGPAFPATIYTEPSPYKTGMSLRDAFAIGALHLIAGAKGVALFDNTGTQWTVLAEPIAEAAYKLADALLAERDKP